MKAFFGEYNCFLSTVNAIPEAANERLQDITRAQLIVNPYGLLHCCRQQYTQNKNTGASYNKLYV